MTSTSQSDDGSSPVYIEACDRLRWYVVGLLRLGRNSGAETADSAGSGTLVQIGASYYILTAAHVAAKLPQSEDVGILRFPGNPGQMQGLKLNMAHVEPTVIGGEPFSEKGPDLALLRLPENFASTLKATNSFCNMSLKRDAALDGKVPSRKCFDCVAGVVAERTSPVEVAADGKLAKRLFEASIEPGILGAFSTSDGFDLAEFTPQVDEGYVAPNSYGGVSGAALWRIFCEEGEGGILTVKEPWMYGLAFWQSDPRQDGSRTIQCHGPNGLYEKLITAVSGSTT
ncbi:MAG: hypothetical protein GC150_13135 [Rhizobiales bacterium]|nr:hypothetical protein [Hyphomicrobiales bacterium]